MIQTNNLFPLPLYPFSDVEQGMAYWQTKKWWVEKVYPLYYPTNYLPPFQIQGSEIEEDQPITQVEIYREDGTLARMLIDEDLDPQGIGFDIACIYGKTITGLADEGRYYLIARSWAGSFVSEIWTAVQDTSRFLLLEWWDEQNFVTEQGTIMYDGTYKNKLYIAAELAKPEYVFDEEGEERDGYFYPEKMLSTKRYHFAFLAPEYLLDALRFVRLSDHVTLTANATVPVGITAPQIVYNCDSFLLTPEWVEAGDLATVSVEFTAGTVAKKIARL